MSVWTTWVTDLAQAEPVGLLFYVGCDHPDALGALPLKEMQTVVLANCNPALQEELADLSHDMAHLRVRPVAIGDSEASVPLHVTSLPGLSGLAEPKGIFELFPNLHLAKTHEVKTARLEALLDEAPTKDTALRLMRIELAGSEQAVMAAVLALPDAKAPDHVFLRMSGTGLYAGTWQTSDLVDLLELSDYEIAAQSDGDPDFPEYWLRRDHRKIELRHLREAKSSAEQESATLKQQVAEARRTAQDQATTLTQQLEDAKNSAKQETEALKQQLAEARQTAQDQATTLTQQLEDAKNSASEQSAKAQQEIDAALRLQAMARGDVADLRAHLEALIAEREAQDGLIREMVTQLQAVLPAPVQPARSTRAKAPTRKKAPSRRSPKAKSDG